jgi:nanoRNase/pAp phosphatase (c-di-AMP/oligoRNAs hydrolase)
VAIGPRDITTNLAYSPQARLVFDHHHSETPRNPTIAGNHIIDPDAPSAARVVYDHYGGAERLPNISPELLGAVDQADSAQYSLEEVIHGGNRFVVYALFPECLVSVQVLWGKQRQNTVLAVGKSILNRTSTAAIGALMLCYGGGGHANAGTCQLPHQDADRVLEELVGHLNATRHARDVPETAPHVT